MDIERKEYGRPLSNLVPDRSNPFPDRPDLLPDQPDLIPERLGLVPDHGPLFVGVRSLPETGSTVPIRPAPAGRAPRLPSAPCAPVCRCRSLLNGVHMSPPCACMTITKNLSVVIGTVVSFGGDALPCALQQGFCPRTILQELLCLLVHCITGFSVLTEVLSVLFASRLSLFYGSTFCTVLRSVPDFLHLPLAVVEWHASFCQFPWSCCLRKQAQLNQQPQITISRSMMEVGMALVIKRGIGPATSTVVVWSDLTMKQRREEIGASCWVRA